MLAAKHTQRKPQAEYPTPLFSRSLAKEIPMAGPNKSGPKGTRHAKSRLSRRQLLTQSAALGAASALMAGCSGTKVAPETLSDENLIGASTLSGERLSPERVHGMKLMLEFTLKQLETLREFDPDEEEPLTMFRL
jgi:hypothetical protein